MWPFKGKSKGEKIQEKKPAVESTNGESKPNKKEKEKKESGKKTEAKNGHGSETNHSLANLSQQLDVAEEAQAQLSQDLQRMTREKLETQNQLAVVREEQEQMQANLEQLTKDKWDLSAVNTDLQQRLQQTVTLAHMQAEGNQSRLQEEVGRMMFQLEEERKVTANLSRSLELERRKVESVEQKAKCGSSSRSQGSRDGRRRSSLLPEEVKDCESRLAQSMEVYRQRCDNLGVSLEGVEARLGDERHRADLGTEVTKLRKLLTEERKKSQGETVRLNETSHLFEQVYLDYIAVMEGVKAAGHEKRLKSQQQSVLSNIAESNMRDNVDSMTARLMQSEEALQREHAAHQAARERLAHAELEAESVPLLRAQVEVYQSDFNAERTARERIAGEKADLEEQLRKAGGGAARAGQGGEAPGLGEPGPQYRPQEAPGPREPQYRPAEAPVPQYRPTEAPGPQYRPQERPQERPGPTREMVNVYNDRTQYDNIPRTVNTRPDPPAAAPEPAELLNCPKCNKEFRNMALLTRHVNDCLDRDF